MSLIFVGDILLDGIVRYYVDHGIGTYNDTLSPVAPIIREADVAIANLESPVGTDEMRNHPVNESERSPFLLGSPQSLELLK